MTAGSVPRQPAGELRLQRRSGIAGSTSRPAERARRTVAAGRGLAEPGAGPGDGRHDGLVDRRRAVDPRSRRSDELRHLDRACCRRVGLHKLPRRRRSVGCPGHRRGRRRFRLDRGRWLGRPLPPGATPGLTGWFQATASSVAQAYLDLTWRHQISTTQYGHFCLIIGIVVWGTAQAAAYDVFGYHRAINGVLLMAIILLANMALTEQDQFPAWSSSALPPWCCCWKVMPRTSARTCSGTASGVGATSRAAPAWRSRFRLGGDMWRVDSDDGRQFGAAGQFLVRVQWQLPRFRDVDQRLSAHREQEPFQPGRRFRKLDRHRVVVQRVRRRCPDHPNAAGRAQHSLARDLLRRLHVDRLVGEPGFAKRSATGCRAERRDPGSGRAGFRGPDHVHLHSAGPRHVSEAPPGGQRARYGERPGHASSRGQLAC